MQQTSRFQTITARFSPSNLKTSFRRSSSASSHASSGRDSYYSSHSNMSSPANTINSVIFRQPSILNMEEERRSYGSELHILEPRPIVYWGSVEERMSTF